MVAYIELTLIKGEMKKITICLALLLLFSSGLAMAQDWPGLARYQDANKKMKQAGPAKVVYMGDSITDSWIDASPDFFAENSYTDRGISGQTSPQMLLRFRQDVIDLKPKVMVLLCGINDIAGNTGPSTIEMIEDNIQSMSELAEANNIKVVLCSLLPSIYVFWKPGLNPAASVAALNQWISDYAFQKHFAYVDYYTALAGDKRDLKEPYSKDGLHPNPAGYKVMEGLVKVAVDKLLE